MDEDVAAIAFAGSIGVSFVGLVSDVVYAFVLTAQDAYKAGYSLVTGLISRPQLLLALLLVFGFTMIWAPYHHVVYQGIQIVHTDILRPIESETLLPMARTLAPVYEKFAEWWNFFNFFVFKHLRKDALYLPIRCKATLPLFRTVIRSIMPVSRAITLLFKMLGTALLGRSSPPQRAQIAVALTLDAAANVTDAFTDVAACYCSFGAHYLDFVTITLRNGNTQCTVANLIGITAELISSAIHFAYHFLEWFLDVFYWAVCTVLPGLGDCGKFPRFRFQEILPDLDETFDRTGALTCCATDAFDDVVNSAILTTVDMYNTIDPTPGLTMPTPRFMRFASPVKATVPVVLEYTRVLYKVSLGALDLDVDALRSVDYSRLYLVATEMCATLTEGAESFGPVLGHALTAGMVSWQLGPLSAVTLAPTAFLYGPRFVNHTCISQVMLLKAIVDIAMNVRDYEGYRSGKYLDCFLSEIREAANVAETDSVELLSIIPAWRSCSVVPTQHDPDTGKPLIFGFPRITCSDSAFHQELGQYLSMQFHMTSVILDYLVSLSENLHSLDAARRVSSGCIFDELEKGVRASYRLWANQMDQIPSSINDIQQIVDFTTELSEETLKWFMPLIGKEENLADALSLAADINRIIHIPLDAIPFSDRMLDEPYVGVRAVGVLDFFPLFSPSFRRQPPLYAESTVLLIEAARFLTELIHADQWPIPREKVQRLLLAEIRFTDEVAKSYASPLCVLRNVITKNGTLVDPPPNCAYYVNVTALNFTMCPLNLIPCPEESMKRIGRALANAVHSLSIKPLFASEEFANELLDPALAELENACAEFDDEFKEWNFNMDLPYWRTRLGLNFAKALSKTGYATAKLLVAVNKILVESLNAMIPQPDSHMPTCTDARPSIGPGGTCKRCTDAADPANRCPANYTCCGISGRCSRRCFDGKGIVEAVDTAAATFVGMVDTIVEPLGVIDPKAAGIGSSAARAPAHLVRNVFKFVMAPAMVPRENFRFILQDMTCTADHLADAIGKSSSLGISVAGRLVSMIVELTGRYNESAGPSAVFNTVELSDAAEDMIEKVLRVPSETAGAGLAIVGTVLDSGKMTNFSHWISEAADSLCGVSQTIGSVPPSVARFIRALDVSRNDELCDAGEFVGAAMSVGTETIQQAINLVGTMTDSSRLGRGFDFSRIFDRVRILIVRAASLAADILYKFMCLFVWDDELRGSLHELLDVIGLFVASLLNVLLSVFECLVNAVVQLLRAIGITGGFCTSGNEDDTFEIIAPFIRSWVLVFDSFGSVLDFLADNLGFVFHLIAKLLKTFLEPASFLHQVIVGIFDAVFKFVELIVAIFTGGDIGRKAAAFGKAVWAVIKTMIQWILRVIDEALFGGAKILQCLWNLWKCIKNAIFKKKKDDGNDDVAAQLGLMAYAFSPDDPCQHTFKEVARAYHQFDSDPLAQGDGPAIDLLTRWKTVVCVSRATEIMNFAGNATKTREAIRARNGNSACVRFGLPPRGWLCDFFSGAEATTEATDTIARALAASVAPVWTHSESGTIAMQVWNHVRDAIGGIDEPTETTKSEERPIRRSRLERRIDSIANTLRGFRKPARHVAAPGRSASAIVSRDEELEVDECGHTIEAAFGLSDFGVEDVCPDNCPNCTDPAKRFTMAQICPVTSCPDIVAAYPEVQSLCARICSSRISTSIFDTLCRSVYTSHVYPVDIRITFQVWAVKDYGGIREAYTDPDEWMTGITDDEINEILDEDNIKSGNESSNGAMKPGDLCTSVGRYGYPRGAFCINKCAGANSLLMQLDANIDRLSSGGAALLRDVCAGLCSPGDLECTEPLAVIESGTMDAAGVAAQLQVCDYEWTPSSSNPYPIAPAGASGGSCAAESMVCGPPDSGATTVRSCKCPPTYLSAGDPRILNSCYCEYESGIVSAGPDPDVLGSWLEFGCPNTFRDPVNHWLTSLAFDSLTASMRPTRTHTHTIAMINTFADQSSFEDSDIWRRNDNIGYTLYPKLNGRDSDYEILPDTLGQLCENRTETVQVTKCDDDDYVCDISPSHCETVEECDEAVWVEEIARFSTTFLALNQSEWVQWTHPIIDGYNINGSPTIDFGVDGACRTGPCHATATYVAPNPSTCIPERDCGRGVWEGNPYSCAVKDVATAYLAIYDTFLYPNHRFDFQVNTTRTVRYCRNVTRCTGPHWSVNETFVASNVTGKCPAADVPNAVRYLGEIGGYRTWKFDYARECRDPDEGCFLETIGCLNVTNDTVGEDVRLCSTLRACTSEAPGCGIPTQSCDYCDRNPTDVLCASCQELDVCSIVHVVGFHPPAPVAENSSNLTSWEEDESEFDDYVPTIVTLSTENATNVSCHHRSACGPTTNVTKIADSFCHYIHENATGYPKKIQLTSDLLNVANHPHLTMRSERYLYPLTFDGPDKTCTTTWRHRGDLCSYLCDDGTGHEGDCTNLFLGDGLDCAHYRSFTDPVPKGIAAARKWFCESIVPPLDTITASHFPMAGSGATVANMYEVAQFTSTDAHACPLGETHACVMRAPSTPVGAGRLTPSQCADLKKYLEATFVPRFRWLTDEIYAKVDAKHQGVNEYDASMPYVLPWSSAPDVYARSADPRSVRDFDQNTLDDLNVLRRRLDPANEREWIAALKEHYDTDDESSEELVLGRALARAGFIEERDSATCSSTLNCRTKDCSFASAEPNKTYRYPLPDEPPPCTSRPLQCTGSLRGNPCSTWYAPFCETSDDPMLDYETETAREARDEAKRVRATEKPSVLDRISKKAAVLRELLRHYAKEGRERRARGEEGAFTVASNAVRRQFEAATCASMPWSKACDRLGRAMARERRDPRVQRLVIPRTDPTAPERMRSTYEALQLARDHSSWLPNVTSLDHSCYFLCDYDFVATAQSSCLSQADGPDGPILHLLQATQDLFRDVCAAADMGDGTALLYEWSDFLPDFNRLHIRPPPPGIAMGPVLHGGIALVPQAGLGAGGETETIGTTVLSFFAWVGSKLFAVDVTPAVPDDEVGLVDGVAELFGFNDTSEFKNGSIAWLKNTNRDPEQGDVGAVYWATYFFLSPSCGAVNGTALRLFGKVPLWSPMWVPYLPTFLGNLTVDVVEYAAGVEWVVPESAVVDAGGCNVTYDYPHWQILSDDAPCSPTFDNICAGYAGTISPLDAIYIALNRYVPNAPQLSLIRSISSLTMTSSWLDKYANLTQRADFEEFWFCFLNVGLPTAVWMSVLYVATGSLGSLLFFRISLAVIQFVATASWFIIAMFVAGWMRNTYS